MPKFRYFLFTQNIDTSLDCHKGRISMPSRVKYICGICPDIRNSEGGTITIGRKSDNELFVNSVHIADDKELYQNKNISVYQENKANNDLFFVLRLGDPANGNYNRDSGIAELKILITYLE